MRRGRGSPDDPGPAACSAEALVARGRGAAGPDPAVAGARAATSSPTSCPSSRCRGGRSTSGSTRRWSCSGVASSRTHGAGSRRSGSRRARRSAYGCGTATYAPRSPSGPAGPPTALGHLRRGLADLHEWQSSFGSLDLQTMVTGHGRAARGARAAGRQSRPGRPRCSSSGPSGRGCWPAGCSRCGCPRDEQVRGRPRGAPVAGRPRGGRRAESAARQAELRQRVRERAWRHARLRGVRRPHDAGRRSSRGWAATGPCVAHVVTARAVVALVVTERRATTHDLGPRAALDALLGGLLPGLDMAAAHLPGTFARSVRGRADAAGCAGSTTSCWRRWPTRLGDRELVLTPSGGAGGRAVDAAAEQPRPAGDRRRVGDVVGRARSETPLRSADGRVRGRAAGRAGRGGDDAPRRRCGRARRVLHGSRGDGRGGQPAGRRGGRAPRLRARPALLGEPAVLRLRARRRAVVRLRHRPARRPCPTSCCCRRARSGRSTLRGGEELIGMTAAWLHAGARCVVASAAAINDAVAHDVLVGVHQGLARGSGRRPRWPGRSSTWIPTVRPRRSSASVERPSVEGTNARRRETRFERLRDRGPRSGERVAPGDGASSGARGLDGLDRRPPRAASGRPRSRRGARRRRPGSRRPPGRRRRGRPRRAGRGRSGRAPTLACRSAPESNSSRLSLQCTRSIRPVIARTSSTTVSSGMPPAWAWQVSRQKPTCSAPSAAAIASKTPLIRSR